MAEETIQELQKNNVLIIYRKFEREYQQSVSEDQFVVSLRALLDSFGKPLDVRFMSAECGTKLYLTGTNKPLWKFRYYVRTTKYDWGEFYLSVEVVFDKVDTSLTAVTFGKFVEKQSDKDQTLQKL